jgi:tyrosinase
MLKIANSYNEPFKADYLKEIESFRLPYWDYFRPRGAEVTFPGIANGGKTSFPYDYSAPRVLTDPELMVHKSPDNGLKQVPNPLCQFLFVDQSIQEEEWQNINSDVCTLFVNLN